MKAFLAGFRELVENGGQIGDKRHGFSFPVTREMLKVLAYNHVNVMGLLISRQVRHYKIFFRSISSWMRSLQARCVRIASSMPAL